MIIPNFSDFIHFCFGKILIFIFLFMSTFNSYVRITYIQLNNY